jgi:hypothetical protein
MRRSLRERGIYRLPDKRAFVVSTSENYYILFSLDAWNYGGLAEYQIGANGKILSKGIPTRWSIEDLSDTEMTAGLRRS